MLKEIVGVLTVELEKLKKRRLDIKKLIEGKVAIVNHSLFSQAIGVSRASLYRRNNKLASRDNQLKEQILQILSVNPSYGRRRIALALGTGRKRAGRVMRLWHQVLQKKSQMEKEKRFKKRGW